MLNILSNFGLFGHRLIVREFLTWSCWLFLLHVIRCSHNWSRAHMDWACSCWNFRRNSWLVFDRDTYFRNILYCPRRGHVALLFLNDMQYRLGRDNKASRFVVCSTATVTHVTPVKSRSIIYMHVSTESYRARTWQSLPLVQSPWRMGSTPVRLCWPLFVLCTWITRNSISHGNDHVAKDTVRYPPLVFFFF